MKASKKEKRKRSAHRQYIEAVIALQGLEVLRGFLPTSALVLVREWAQEHSGELKEDWLLCQQNQTPQKIPPLE